MATTSAWLAGVQPGFAQGSRRAPEIVVFSKIYQELKLDYEQAAELTAAAGLLGIDCPVRPGGEVLPERVEEDLPKYVAALKARKLTMPLIVTSITEIGSPFTNQVLRTARSLGIRHYRLGFRSPKPGRALENEIAEVKARLKDLAELNAELGITGLFQNHSQAGTTGYMGGDLGQMAELIAGLDPAHLGVAFDIGHALVMHGKQWLPHFERLRRWVKIVYVKDVKLPRQWVPLGQGDIHATGYFQLLKEMNYSQPISLHVEYDWKDGDSKGTREQLLKHLKADRKTLSAWLR